MMDQSRILLGEARLMYKELEFLSSKQFVRIQPGLHIIKAALAATFLLQLDWAVEPFLSAD
jgi:hypothetical protein